MVRNPFDAIASTKIEKTEKKKTAEKRITHLKKKAQRFFKKAGYAKKSIELVGRDRIHELRHEEFVADPKSHLAALCSFLGVEPTEEYLDDCASIVFPKPRPTRFRLEWTPELIEWVNHRMADFEFFNGYSYDG